MNFEQALQNNLFSKGQDKSFVDKVLARDETQAIREIMTKERWTRKEVQAMSSLVTGTLSKLTRLNAQTFPLINKLYLWIGEAVKLAEGMYDYEERLNTYKGLCAECNKYILIEGKKKKEGIEICDCVNPNPSFEMTERAKSIFLNGRNNIEHLIRYQFSLYLNIMGTSLSIGGHAFDNLIQNKFEVNYNEQGKLGAQTPQQRGGI